MKITPSRLNNNNKKTQDSKKQPKKMTEPQQKIPNNNNNNENKPSIQVIGAGLGRTGTKSLQTALEILGYKTYHFPPPHHSGQWASLVDSLSPSSSSSSSPVTTPEMVLQMVADEGYTATCDQPMADLYFEQLTLFPDSKVVLTGIFPFFSVFSSSLCSSSLPLSIFIPLSSQSETPQKNGQHPGAPS